MKKNKILIVDDVRVNREMLKRMLDEIFHNEYEYLEADNGKDAIKILSLEFSSIALMLLDIVMPIMDGFQVLEVLHEKKLNNKLPIVMITSNDSEELERKVYEEGIADYIKKPFNRYIIQVRLKNTLELYQHKFELERMVRKQTAKLREANEQLMDSMSNIVEFRNLESGMHVKRIKKFTACLLRDIRENCPEYHISQKNEYLIVQASSMHDIGKITIPDSILSKSDRLTHQEFNIMKAHTTKGAEMVSKTLKFMEEVQYQYCYDICRHHHERYDGRGYPDGLKGEDISIAAQIVSLADVYDALVSERVYKPPFDKETAFSMIQNGECGAFSDKMLAAFARVKPEFEKLADMLKE